MRKLSNLSLFFSFTIAVLSCIASTLGVFVPGIYKNEIKSVAADFRGQDLGTLLIVTPFFIYSILSANKGSIRGRLMWMGVLIFYIYQYLLYSAGMAFNYLYLIFILIFSISLITFVRGIIEIDFAILKKSFSGKFPIFTTAISEMTLAMMLACMWLSNILGKYFNERFEMVNPESSAKMISQTMDLGFLVPMGICSGGLLLQKKLIGFFLTSLTLIGAPCLLLTFITARIATKTIGIEVMMEEQLFGIGGMIILLFLAYKFYKAIPRYKKS